MSTEEVLVTKKDRREGKGRVIALSRRVYKIINSDVFYVESETADNRFYFVMFDPVKNYEYCTCKDYENRHQKCKHIFGVEFAIKDNVVTMTDELPLNTTKQLEYEGNHYEF